MTEVTLIAEWQVEGGPDGIAVSPQSEVFVNINNSHRVVKYSSMGELLAAWSIPGAASGIAVSPQGEVLVNINNSHRVVSYSAGGQVSVNINQNHRVVKYSATGELLAEWAAPGEARGMAVGPEGEILVNINNSHRVLSYSAGGQISVNINNSHRVVRYSPEGEPLEEWPSEEGSGPLAIGPEGEVFSITSVLRVTKQSRDGRPLLDGSEVAGVIETNGIAVGPDGDVFVNINNSHRVVKVSADGELLASWGGEGDQPGEFRSPAGVALGPEGRVYVADRGNGRVQVFDCP